MKMILKIYRNGEQVNEIISDDDTQIYKNVAQILWSKHIKRATRTFIDYLNDNLRVTQVFDDSRTKIDKVTYKYEYLIENISL